MIIPIPIIVNNNYESSKCPNCEHDEEIVKVCKHCKYEYPEEEGSGWVIFCTITALILFIFIVSSFVIWAIDRSLQYEPYTGTYVQFLKEGFIAFWNLLKDIV